MIQSVQVSVMPEKEVYARSQTQMSRWGTLEGRMAELSVKRDGLFDDPSFSTSVFPCPLLISLSVDRRCSCSGVVYATLRVLLSIS